MRRHLKNLGVCVVLATLVSTPLRAQSSRSKSVNLQVIAEVVENCDLTVEDMPFGPYDPVGANRTRPLTHISRISATCTPGASVRVDIDGGLHGGGRNPEMAGPGGGRLVYELVWLGTSGLSSPPAGSGPRGLPAVADANGKINVRVQGTVFAGQNATVGAYSDTLVVTIRF